MIVQSYALTARKSDADTLVEALVGFSEWARAQPGNKGCLTLCATDSPVDFQFLEFWEDEAARQAAGRAMPKALMVPLMASLDRHPTTTTYSVSAPVTVPPALKRS